MDSVTGLGLRSFSAVQAQDAINHSFIPFHAYDFVQISRFVCGCLFVRPSGPK